MDLKVFIVKLKRANIKPEFGVFGEQPTFDELSLKIITLCQIPRDRLTITFRNAEKQFIDLTNDDALQEFYKSLDPDCKYIKFVVQDSQAPDTTISSTWSAGSNLSDLSKTDNKGKRKAEAEPEEQGQRNSSVPENHLPLKRVKLGDGVLDSRLPLEDVLEKYHETLCGVSSDPRWYSDPRNFGLLPFPCTYTIPERFLLRNGLFEYMGREEFKKAYNYVSSLKLDGLSNLYIHGTMGYGKSYILAALACLLYRQGKRVVFIPDCRAMLIEPLVYIKCALLCTFANPSLKEEREWIRACASVSELGAFCHSLDRSTLYFIVDQVNAFDESAPNMDKIPDGDKEAGQKIINHLSAGHFLITSASANYQTARYMAQKQTGEEKMSVKGGMTENEMMQWWKHHESMLPKFKDDQKKMEIEHFTGCIPLLLRPLFQFPQQDFDEVEEAFWASSEIVAVEVNIKEFSDDRRKMGDWLYSDYIDTLFNCLIQGDAPSNRSESFDYRYFYHNGISGECACGMAREVAAVLIAKWKFSRFYEPKWIDSLHTFKDNPSTLGYQVEKICLACIASIGLNYDGKSTKPQAPIWFRGRNLDALLDAISPTDPSGLYLPSHPQFEDIDALILEYNHTAKTLNVIPIQVTINKKHKDSETLFYNKWKKLALKFPGITLTSTFIWITELTKSSKTITEEVRETRTMLQMKKQTHQQVFLAAEDVHKPLAEALERIRDLQKERDLALY